MLVLLRFLSPELECLPILKITQNLELGIFMSFRVRKARNFADLSKSCDDTFAKLIQSGVSPEELYDTVCKQVISHIKHTFFIHCIL